MSGKLLTVLAVLILNFIGVIFLESKMQNYFTLELVIIVVGILLSILALVGIAAESRWAWPFSTILFALFLANVLFLHVNIHAFGTFGVLLFVNTIGLLMSILSIENEDASGPWDEGIPQIETYNKEEPEKVTYKAPSVKARKKKR